MQGDLQICAAPQSQQSFIVERIFLQMEKIAVIIKARIIQRPDFGAGRGLIWKAQLKRGLCKTCGKTDFIAPIRCAAALPKPQQKGGIVMDIVNVYYLVSIVSGIIIAVNALIDIAEKIAGRESSLSKNGKE